MKPTVNGKKPIASKTLKYSAYQANMLDIPPAIKVELEKQGLEGRWVNYNRYVSDGNFHREGWVPFKPAKSDSDNGFFFGNNPDGLIRRKELMLAARPKEICEAHRESLQEKAAKLKASVDSDYRRSIKDAGFKTQIYEESDNE